MKNLYSLINTLEWFWYTPKTQFRTVTKQLFTRR